jgi:hypothetical protein
VHSDTAWLTNDHSFDEAVLVASKFGQAYTGLKSEAEWRNKRGDKPTEMPTDSPTGEQRLGNLADIDPAAKVLEALVALDADGQRFEIGYLWASLSIGVELRGIRVALERLVGMDVPMPVNDGSEDDWLA